MLPQRFAELADDLAPLRRGPGAPLEKGLGGPGGDPLVVLGGDLVDDGEQASPFAGLSDS